MHFKKSVEVQLFFDRFISLPPISLLVFVDITLRRQILRMIQNKQCFFFKKPTEIYLPVNKKKVKGAEKNT